MNITLFFAGFFLEISAIRGLGIKQSYNKYLYEVSIWTTKTFYTFIAWSWGREIWRSITPGKSYFLRAKMVEIVYQGFWGFSFSFFLIIVCCLWLFYWEDSKLDCCYVPLLLKEPFYWLLSWMLSPQSL